MLCLVNGTAKRDCMSVAVSDKHNNSVIIIIIIIVYFPENYRLVHMLHTRKSYVNIVYKCNRRDGCQRNRKFIIIIV